MHATDRKLCWRHRAFALLILLSTTNVVFAEGVVNTVFSIDSAFFRSALPAVNREQTEAAVAESLAATARSHFGYLDWKPAANTNAASPKLILRMTEVSGGSCAPAIKLQWSAALATTERKLANVSQHPLFTGCEANPPTQEPERLVQAIVAAVKLMLDNEATRKQISNQLLKLVPIATALNNHNDIMLLLPVSPARLLADSESKMIARFRYAKPGMPPVSSHIEFHPEESEIDDSVQLFILKIRVPSLPTPSLGDGAYWHELLVDILNGSASLDAQVFMVEYVSNPFAGETVGSSGVVSEM